MSSNEFEDVAFNLTKENPISKPFQSQYGWHIVKFQKITENVKYINLPWYVILALGVLLMIQVAQLFSMLKAVKREFMQMDPDN